MLFSIKLHYVQSHNEMESHAHNKWLENITIDGCVVFSGPLNNRSDYFVLFKNTSEEKVIELVDLNPLVRLNMATAEVKSVTPEDAAEFINSHWGEESDNNSLH